MTGINQTTRIRLIVKAAGVPFNWMYNDSNKDHRKLKFAWNGWMPPRKKVTMWDRNVKEGLAAAKIKYSEAGFIECMREGYGPYLAYVIRLPYRGQRVRNSALYVESRGLVGGGVTSR